MKSKQDFTEIVRDDDILTRTIAKVIEDCLPEHIPMAPADYGICPFPEGSNACRSQFLANLKEKYGIEIGESK